MGFKDCKRREFAPSYPRRGEGGRSKAEAG
jgi:hypothetical protein